MPGTLLTWRSRARLAEQRVQSVLYSYQQQLAQPWLPVQHVSCTQVHSTVTYIWAKRSWHCPRLQAKHVLYIVMDGQALNPLQPTH
jgi:hypothetical protein